MLAPFSHLLVLTRYGQLYSKDVAKIDREHPVCLMTWHYASRQQLDMLGLLNGASSYPNPLPEA